METVIGEYRLLESIGNGACGEVFRAEHTITRRVEAIKILRDTMHAGARDEAPLLREIEIQASLRHPHIATVHHAFRIPEGLALVMELVEGEPLSAILERGRIPLPQGAAYVLQTLDALAYAHQRRVVHRDVKPANIVVASDGSVKLTDFGLAQLLDDGDASASGTAAGSPYYMAPEQVTGLVPADARSDCYSVGVILYEIATGRRPFEGAGAFDIMLQHRESAPLAPVSLDPLLGPALNAVILQALEKDPDRRFRSASEFRAALEQVLAASPAMRPRRTGSAPLRWVLAALVAALGVAVSIGSAVTFLPVLRRAPISTVALPNAPAPPVSAPPVTAPPAAPEAAPPAQAPVASEPAPAGSPHQPAAKRKPARSKPTAALPPQSLPNSAFALPEPRVEASVPASEPPLFDVAPRPSADIGEPNPTAATEPAKRQSRLRRALGRIAHPFSRSPAAPSPKE